MAICNRDLGTGQQQTEFNTNFGAFSTGASNATVTVPLAMIPYPATLSKVRVGALGLSGAPVMSFSISRFITGSGNTLYTGGMTTLTLVAAGTSGVQTVVTAAAGSTALNLLTGDVILGTFDGQDAAATSVATSIVIQAVQDIRTWFGS
jgi:hypothetical protein